MSFVVQSYRSEVGQGLFMDWTLQFLLNYTFWESFGHLVDFAALYWIEQVTNPAAE